MVEYIRGAFVDKPIETPQIYVTAHHLIGSSGQDLAIDGGDVLGDIVTKTHDTSLFNTQRNASAGHGGRYSAGRRYPSTTPASKFKSPSNRIIDNFPSVLGILSGPSRTLTPQLRAQQTKAKIQNRITQARNTLMKNRRMVMGKIGRLR